MSRSPWLELALLLVRVAAERQVADGARETAEARVWNARVAPQVPGVLDLQAAVERHPSATSPSADVQDVLRVTHQDLGEVAEVFSEGGSSSRDAPDDGSAARRVREAPLASNINLMVDTLLERLRPRMPSSVELDDVEKPFKKKLLLLPVFGVLRATGGTLEDLRTLRRTSDVKLSLTADGARLTGAAGLSTLRFAYDYEVSLLGAGLSGRITGSVGDNSVGFALAVSYDGRGGCAVSVEELRVLRLDQVEVEVTGVGVLNWLASTITTAAVNEAKDKIGGHVEAGLVRAVERAVSENNLCDFLGAR
ncbi:uncharacterized protein LOC134542995 [Bacillus rossius redtenbacheri]|uniref:uncharacterized protein LOC134542995 n=1 Tax=Bacillus rossius redtenbacheri TaxID=93214 RepID=UPI002FDD5D87